MSRKGFSKKKKTVVIEGARLVDCKDCAYSVGPVVNFLVGCDNEQANPNGYKKGTYLKQCEYFKKRR